MSFDEGRVDGKWDVRNGNMKLLKANVYEALLKDVDANPHLNLDSNSVTEWIYL